jgi:hypothetical protein
LKEISVPQTKPAPQRTASAISLAFQRVADGVAQVMMTGATTSAASAFGTHHTRVVGNNSSHSTVPL